MLGSHCECEEANVCGLRIGTHSRMVAAPRQQRRTLLIASFGLNVLLAGLGLVALSERSLSVEPRARSCCNAGGACACPAEVHARAVAARFPWLIIGLPTVPRSGVDYLTPTLDALHTELPSDGNVHAYVMSMSVTHAVFDRLESVYTTSRHFRFLRAPAAGLADPEGEKHDTGTRDRPGYAVRRQTRHFTLLLKAAANRSQYFMTMEDDFLACAQIVPTLQHAIAKAHHYAGDWIALRVSYGLAGIVLRGRDLAPLAAYMESRYRARPPDHIAVEWFAGETAASKAYRNGRQNLAFRYNVLEHVGAVSSLRGTASPEYPHCYDELKEPVNFAVEAFSSKDCPHDDVWPCTRLPPTTSHFGEALSDTFEGSVAARAARPNTLLYMRRVSHRSSTLGDGEEAPRGGGAGDGVWRGPTITRSRPRTWKQARSAARGHL